MRAEEPDTRVQDAEAAMQRGMAASQRNEHEVALAAYEEAAKLVPDANIPHKLAGESLEALNRWVEAIAAYKRYVQIKPDAKGVPEITARIERIEKEHLTTLEIKCTPPGAVIAFDGKAAGVTPLAPVTLVAPASIAIAVTSPGFTAKSTKLELQPGKPASYDCALEPIVIKPPPVLTIKKPPPPPEKPWYQRWTVLGPAIGVAVVVIGAGIVLSLGDGVPDSDGGSHPFP